MILSQVDPDCSWLSVVKARSHRLRQKAKETVSLLSPSQLGIEPN